MGIRNILSLHREASFRFLLVTLILSITIGCQHTRRSEVGSERDKGVTLTKSPPSIEIPEFTGKRAPKVGLLLGPGGAKSFAHVGVLQEMERRKLPITAVAGLGWGALTGGLYALNGEVHEVDWKLSQIPKMNFSSKNFFSRKKQALATREFDSYLSKIFSGAKIRRMKIPFTCPYVSGRSGKVKLAKKGSTKGFVKACWQYPPIFPVNKVMGAPYAVGSAVNFLKSQGAELIILIDVLGRANQKDFDIWGDSKWSWFAWTPVQESLNKAKLYGVHEVIRVDTTSYSLVDVEQRLRLIQLGKQESSAPIESIVEKYDF